MTKNIFNWWLVTGIKLEINAESSQMAIASNRIEISTPIANFFISLPQCIKIDIFIIGISLAKYTHWTAFSKNNSNNNNNWKMLTIRPQCQDESVEFGKQTSIQ